MSPVTQAAVPGSTAESTTGTTDGSGSGFLFEPDQPELALAATAAVDDVVVADWLHAHPEFFEQHADLLAEVRIRHRHGGRAISLVERQVTVLRERNKALESKMAELIRIGQDNDGIDTRLQQLARDLLRAADPAQLPAILVEGLQDGFAVPQVAIRLWGIEGPGSPFTDEVSEPTRRRAGEMTQPYCGPNSHPEAAGWLPGAGADTASIALLALQVVRAPGALATTFGMLVLGSSDAARFQAGMGTAFLSRIGDIAGASLSRLLD